MFGRFARPLAALGRPAAASGAVLLGGSSHWCDEGRSTRDPESLVRFWFDGAKSGYDARWFDRNSEWYRRFEAGRSEWEAVWERARRGPRLEREADAMATLETVMLLDQIPRSMWANTPRAYASDELAVEVARDAVARGADKDLAPEYRVWLYMPFLHSERLDDQERCVKAMAEVAAAHPRVRPFYAAAVAHHRAVSKFGRLPERNVVLGRASTAEEEAWLRTNPTA